MLFISYSTLDRDIATEVYHRLTKEKYHLPFLDYHPDAGIPGGAPWEKELRWQLKVARGVIILYSENSDKSKWCFAELQQAIDLKKKIIPLKIDGHPLSDQLKPLQAIDFTVRDEDAYERLWRALEEAGLKPDDDFSWPREECPYPGFAPFQEEHAGVYFGREAELTDFFKQLAELRTSTLQRLLYVIGPSGSGKSSFVRAGVVPRLKFKQTANWLVLSSFRWRDLATEGRSWGERLAEDLQSAYQEYLGKPQWDAAKRSVRYRTDGSPQSIIQAAQCFSNDVKDLQTALGRRHSTPLLILDQFEELLVSISQRDANKPPADAEGGARNPDDQGTQSELTPPQVDHSNPALEFVQFLGKLLTATDSPCRCLATVRSDFLPSLQETAALVDWNESTGLFRLDVLKPERLFDVVRLPAHAVDVTFEPESLVNKIVTETNTSDALPLLAFTLQQFFAARENGKLTQANYEARIGGLERCLQTVANGVLEGPLGTNGQPIRPDERAVNGLRISFLRHLTTYVEATGGKRSGGFVRRSERWSKLPQEAHELLSKMVELRLLTKDRSANGVDAESTVEVTHESLFRVWPTLKEWLDQDRDTMILRNRIEQLRVRWIARSQPTEDLCPIGLLGEAEIRGSADAKLFSEYQQTYLMQSRGYYESEARRLRDLQDHLDDAQVDLGRKKMDLRRSRLQLWSAAAGVIVLIGVAGIIGTWARRNVTIGQALSECLRADQLIREGSREGLAVAIAAFEKAAIPETSFSLRSAMLLIPAPVETLENVGLHRLGGYSADGKLLLAIAMSDQRAASQIAIWDITKRELRTTLTGHKNHVHSALFSPDGKYVVTASQDNTARLWDAQSGKSLAILKHNGNVSSARFVLGGERILSVSSDGTAKLWNISGEQIAVFKHSEKEVWGADISPDGERLVTVGREKVARIWDVPNSTPAEGKLLSTYEAHLDSIYSVRFGPDEMTVVTASQDSTAHVWNCLTGKTLAVLKGHIYPLHDAIIHPNGKVVATASRDGTVRLWQLDGVLLNILRPANYRRNQRSEIHSLEFLENGRWLVSEEDSHTRRWDMNNLVGEMVDPAEIPRAVSFSGRGPAIAPDGRTLALVDGSRVAIYPFEQAEVLSVSPSVQRAAFSADGKQFLVCNNGYLERYDATNGMREVAVPWESYVVGMEFDGEGVHCSVASNNGTVAIVKTADLTTLSTLTIPGNRDKELGPLFAGESHSWLLAKFSKDNKRLISLSTDRTVRISEIETGKLLRSFGEGRVAEAMFNHSANRLIFTLYEDTFTTIVDTETGVEVAKLQAERGQFYGQVWISDDGQVAVVNSAEDGVHVMEEDTPSTVQIWRLDAGGPRLVPATEKHLHGWIAMSRRGLALSAKGGRDRGFEIWNAAKGRALSTLQTSDVIWHAQFSESDRFVATWSDGPEVVIWDVATGALVTRLPGNAGTVKQVTFYSGDQHVMVVRDDGTARVYTLDVVKLLRLARRRAEVLLSK